jgi:hypothetical protein
MVRTSYDEWKIKIFRALLKIMPLVLQICGTKSISHHIKPSCLEISSPHPHRATIAAVHTTADSCRHRPRRDVPQRFHGDSCLPSPPLARPPSGEEEASSGIGDGDSTLHFGLLIVVRCVGRCLLGGVWHLGVTKFQSFAPYFVPFEKVAATLFYIISNV